MYKVARDQNSIESHIIGLIFKNISVQCVLLNFRPDLNKLFIILFNFKSCIFLNNLIDLYIIFKKIFPHK